MRMENKTPREILGHKVKFYRKQIGLSQVQLGERLGYNSSGTISLIERGERGMDQDIIAKTADVFGVHPMVLMSTKDYTDEQLEIFLTISKIIDDPKSENYQTLQKLLPIFKS